MNRKGQVLVTFALLIPFMFLLLSIIIDLGFLYVEKRNMDNSVKQVLTYGMNHLTDSDLEVKIKDLLNKNVSNIESINITINDEIKIEIMKYEPSIFSLVLSKTRYQLKSNYRSYLKEEKVIIIKE